MNGGSSMPDARFACRPGNSNSQFSIRVADRFDLRGNADLNRRQHRYFTIRVTNW
jgi:hypothetical protein